eukprot:8543718-Pyramimonas_sp.AAC.1
MARGIWEPKANEELAVAVHELTARVAERRSITWEHVCGHTGEHDNETADRCAEIGRRGYASEQSKRWTAPAPALQDLNYTETDACKKCGMRVLTKELKLHFRRCTSTERA